MLSLAQLKAHLRLPESDTTQDATLTEWLAVAQAAFRVESKRRWPVEGEPALTVVVDPAADPLVYRFVSFLDESVLSPDEQLTAGQWLRFTLAHWYENRQTVAVGLNVTEVPETAKKLMSLLRTPTI